ncbi:uncharacterized protein LOC125676402 [Ostrea edulis]|uniref:uncharacterized protein LOC125676402 n=1 Tax=Ostrea edulis TaxID=37623 RepID=UPI0024AFB737|nr:uncharacterized protein LOC125676402 [Ostrea edulis]XP_056020468.1 uncharacterized protein LOC125676402 [Ostrea edulis]
MDETQDEVDGTRLNNTVREDNVSSTSAVENAKGDILPDKEKSEIKASNSTPSESLNKEKVERKSARNIFDDLLAKDDESKCPSLNVNEKSKEGDKDHNPVIPIINISQENNQETVLKPQNQDKELSDTTTENVCQEMEKDNFRSQENDSSLDTPCPTIDEKGSSQKILEDLETSHSVNTCDSSENSMPTNQDVDSDFSRNSGTVSEDSKGQKDVSRDEKAVEEKEHHKSECDFEHVPETQLNEVSEEVSKGKEDCSGEKLEKEEIIRLEGKSDETADAVKDTGSKENILDVEDNDAAQQGNTGKHIDGKQEEPSHCGKEEEAVEQVEEREQRVKHSANEDGNLEINFEDSQNLVIDIQESDESDTMVINQTETDSTCEEYNAEKERNTAEDSAEKERNTTDDGAEKERNTAEGSAENERNTTDDGAEKVRNTTEDSAEKERNTTEDGAEKERNTAEDSAEKERNTTQDIAEKERNTTEDSAEKERNTAVGKCNENSTSVHGSGVNNKKALSNENISEKEVLEKALDQKDSNCSTDSTTVKKSEDGVEEIQMLFQEFVKSSSKSQVISSNSNTSSKQKEVISSNTSSKQKESKTSSSKKGSTEAAWSTVGLVRCSHCLFTTDQKDLLDNHLSSCTKKNAKKEEIHLLYSANGKYGCKNCLFVSSQRKKFEEHVAFHLLADPYICLTCLITYDSKKEIEKHVKQQHSNKMVKCGLRGSKKINKIIEELCTKKEVAFHGRRLEKSILMSVMDQKSAQNQFLKTPTTVNQLPKTIEEIENIIAKDLIHTTTILSVPTVSKVNQSQNILSTKAVLPVCAATSALSQVVPTKLPVNVTSVHQTVLAQPLTFQAPAVRGPVLCNVVTCQPQPVIFVPVNPVQVSLPQQMQAGSVVSGPFSLKSGNGQMGSRLVPVCRPPIGQFVNITPARPTPHAVTSNKQTQRLLVVPANNPAATTVNQAKSSVHINQVQQSLPTTVTTMDMHSFDYNLKKNPVDPSSSSVVNGHSGFLKLSVKEDENSTKADNQLLFKKSGQLYSCHTCDFKSEIEENFMKHIWKHIHLLKNMCKLREHLDYKPNMSCKLVSKIMHGLKCAAAAAEAQRKASSETKKTIQTPEQIVLSSDEEEDTNKDIIQTVLQTPNIEEKFDSNNDENELQIKITSTFSLSEPLSDMQCTEAVQPTEVEEETISQPDEGEEVSRSYREMSEKDMFRDLSPDSVSADDTKSAEDQTADKEKGTNNAEASNTAFNESDSGRKEQETESEIHQDNGIEMDVPKEVHDAPSNVNIVDSIGVNDVPALEAKVDDHKVSAVSLKFYQCGFESCGFAGLTSTEYRDHISSLHSGAKEFKCAHCGHKSYTDECHFRHIYCHAKNQSGLLFKCGDGCMYASNILKHFKDHLYQVHSNLQSYKCSSCTEVFDNIDGLVNHCETNRLQFVLCPYCTMRDPNRRIVLKHISTMHPGKPRQITVTSQLVCQEREMNSYIAPKPLSPISNPILPEPKLKEESETLPKPLEDSMPVGVDSIKVERMDSPAGENSNLNKNEHSEYEEEIDVLSTNEPVEERQTVEKTGMKLGIGSLIRCSKCSYLAGSNLLLRKHRLQHIRPSDRSRPFCCPVCPTSSDSISKFERHINLHEGHLEIIIYMCELCNYQTNVSDKINFHLQKSHKGSDLLNDFRSRILETNVTVYECEICENLYKSKREYVVHMSKHKSSKFKAVTNAPVSIDKYHCDCCSFSCDNKNSLIQHTKIHLLVTNPLAVEEAKQKPKKEYTGPRKPFYIPPGNVFKDIIKCSECPFKTKTRLDLLRHIKGHQNLEPRMTKFPRKEANPQERSTRELVKFQFGKRKHSSENESNKRLRTADNESEEEIDVESDFTIPKRKQVAMKSTSGVNVKNIKQANLYFLGGDLLHKKLQPCFTKEEEEPIFQCIMCSDVFEDKYTLHKHILEHMQISFYKCKYCENGELETSAMVTHIQKMHRKPIQHTRINLEELEDEINRAIHNIKSKEYWGESESLPDEKPILNVPIISPSVTSEPDVFADRKESVSMSALSPIILKQPKLKEKLSSTPEKNKLPECVIAFENGFKCTVCNQQAIQSYILVRHAMTHCSRKRYACPYCDKRSHYKSDICKHLHMKHKGEEFRVKYDKTDVELDADYIAPNLLQQILDTPDEVEAEEEEHEDVKVEIKTEEDSKEFESNDRKGKKVVVGFRSVYKCLLCKITLKGRGKIYKHIRETKCKRPLWRCSACRTRKFKSDKEKVIKDHIKDVHQMTGDAKPVLCAINGKIRKHTMPITVTKHEEGIKEIKKSEEFASEETVREKESNGAVATIVKRGDLWQCSNCSYITHSRANCIRHTFTHTLYKKFGCPVCSFRAKCSRGVKNHMRNCHPRERIRFKIYTEVSSSPKKSIQEDQTKQKEKLTITAEQPVSYQCQECGFISERKSSLSKHINAKCFTPLKGCSECDFTSINQEEMAKHIKNSHKTATVTNLPLSDKIITLNCSKSDKYIESPINEKGGKRTKDRFQLKVNPSIKSPVSKPLSTEMKMWSEENVRQTMNCPVCNDDFNDLRAFRDHFVNEHRDKKLLCGECEEYAAHLPSLLFRHARLFHNKTRLVDLKLTAISQETIHEKGLDQRPVILYRCPKCDKISERCPLRRHMYTHYNYNPYHCNHCDMKCKMQKNIRVHLSKIHPDKSMNEYTFRKNAKLEKEISDILERSRYQTLSRKTKMSASFTKKGQPTSAHLTPKLRIKKEVLETEDNEDYHETEDEEEEEEESEEEEDNEPRGDLKNMFSPCHNYKVEFDNRRQKTIYKCSICPYQSTVNKTIVTHFYHHVPHVFKCPYCDFQCYPRSKIANHILKLHPGKAVHVVDLRQCMGNLKFRNYEKKGCASKPKSKEWKKNVRLKLNFSPKKRQSPTAVSRKRKKADHDSPDTSKDSGKLTYICNLCDHRAGGLYHFRQHLASHDGFQHLVPGTQIESRLKCGYCSYLAVDDNDFKTHMEYHFATRPFSCPYCTFSQYRASGITNHIRRTHPGKPIDVVKESDSSFLIGQELDAKAMIVNMEPKVKLMDILVMDSEEFKKLLNNSDVCVIDLNYIPDEKFDAVSKTLGLEIAENEVEDAPPIKKVKKESIPHDKMEDEKIDKLGDLETMIANGEIKIEENQKYEDVSDDELNVNDEASYEDVSENEDIPSD